MFELETNQLENLLLVRLPDKAVELAEGIILDSFKAETFKGAAAGGKWDSRKSNKKGDSGRALLVKSGDLRRSIRVYYDSSTRMIVLESDKSVGGGKWNLAQIHNEGLKPVPQRQFMPMKEEDFTEWNRLISEWLEKELDAIFQ